METSIVNDNFVHNSNYKRIYIKQNIMIMKELSIEEKARRYDEAIEIAKEINNEQRAQPFNIMTRVFPELKDEDERIRKEIINYLEQTVPHHHHDELLKSKEWIAWLEKQGEQNPANNVKPKFKIGDWAVSNLDKKARQISEVYFDEYNNYYVVESNEYDIEEYDRLHHLWTIQDAKDGDVLVDGNFIVIFKENNYNLSDKSGCMSLSCSFDINNDKFYTESGGYNPTYFYPATKEQRDLLFQKMKEAGYEWDSEKKELKKIIDEKLIKKNLQDNSSRRMFEQKSAWSEDDENRVNRLIAYFEDKESFTAEDDIVYANWLKSLKGRVQPQPKQEWSKEEEENFKKAIKVLKVSNFHNTADMLQKMKYKLIPREETNNWKPSEKQMKALGVATNICNVPEKEYLELEKLYQDLKKLKAGKL